MLAGTGCSFDRAEPQADRPPAPSAAVSPTHVAEPTPKASPRRDRRGVTCVPVDEAVAADIAAGAAAGFELVPGLTAAYRPRSLPGTYLVVMVFTRPGGGAADAGVWAVRGSIAPGRHGPITSVDRVAREVTTWPRDGRVDEAAVAVSEVRACTLV